MMKNTRFLKQQYELFVLYCETGLVEWQNNKNKQLWNCIFYNYLLFVFFISSITAEEKIWVE